MTLAPRTIPPFVVFYDPLANPGDDYSADSPAQPRSRSRNHEPRRRVQPQSCQQDQRERARAEVARDLQILMDSLHS